jgi:hypothetical protein
VCGVDSGVLTGMIGYIYIYIVSGVLREEVTSVLHLLK